MRLHEQEESETKEGPLVPLRKSGCRSIPLGITPQQITKAPITNLQLKGLLLGDVDSLANLRALARGARVLVGQLQITSPSLATALASPSDRQRGAVEEYESHVSVHTVALGEHRLNGARWHGWPRVVDERSRSLHLEH